MPSDAPCHWFSCGPQTSSSEEAASGLWRSETMIRYEMTLPREAAHDTVFQLGLLGCCQFKDCMDGVAAFQRPFTSDIRRCEEVERRLRYIGEHCRRSGVTLTAVGNDTPASSLKSPKGGDRDSTVPTLRRREREEHVAYVPQASMSCLDRVETGLDARERDLRALVMTLSNLRRDIRVTKEALLVQAVQQDSDRGQETVVRSTRRFSHAAATVSAAESTSMVTMREAGGLMAAGGSEATYGSAATFDNPSSSYHPAMAATGRSLCGIISASRLDMLGRLVYRISRGNSVLRSWNIDHLEWLLSPLNGEGNHNGGGDEEEADGDGVDEDDDGGENGGDAAAEARTSQAVFAIYCHAPRMLDRLRKVVNSVGGRMYSEDVFSRPLRQDLAALQSAYVQSRQQKRDLLARCGGEFLAHSRYLRLQKSVLSVLNMLQFSGSLCRAQFWAPARREGDIRTALEEATRTACADAPTILGRSRNQRNPPTYFEANKYIAIFQGIVDSYGVARYKEINPGVFTIVTFPYLFGIMYGDIGHGVLLTLVALGLIAAERYVEGKRQNEIFSMIYAGRYLLLLMGIFATYIGILYNDFFGFSIGLFESGYTWPTFPAEGGPGGVVHPLHPSGRPSVKPDNPYPFGIDVAWAETENKLEFYNSVKMKCAVIVGIIQMSAGIVLSLFNYLRRRHVDMYKVWFLFVPQLLFMLCTFGYMALMIVIKWLTPWSNTNDAPSLLETMTNFFLSPGSVTKELYPGQGGVQGFLFVIAFAMTPVMLLVPSFIEKRRLREGYTIVASPPSDNHNHHNHNDGSNSMDGGEERLSINHPHGGGATEADNDDEHQPHDPTEITIHYIIHTIEFVLGAVSNTASYLRLWALSLAHAQLSEVFFRFGVVQVLNADNTGVMVFVGIGVWLGATIGVLLGMEALSAFLHSLRLHWVEFQSKFYLGDGTAFSPLDLVLICSEPIDV